MNQAPRRRCHQSAPQPLCVLHHEAWKRSDLNQRPYCEAEGIPLKTFGNWRATFKAEPQPPERKLLYWRRGFPRAAAAARPRSAVPTDERHAIDLVGKQTWS